MIPQGIVYVHKRLDDLSQSTGEPGYPPISVIGRARAFVDVWFDLIEHTPSVTPGEWRSVDFIWHRNGHFVEIEISENEDYQEYVFIRCDSTGKIDGHLGCTLMAKAVEVLNGAL